MQIFAIETETQVSYKKHAITKRNLCFMLTNPDSSELVFSNRILQLQHTEGMWVYLQNIDRKNKTSQNHKRITVNQYDSINKTFKPPADVAESVCLTGL